MRKLSYLLTALVCFAIGVGAVLLFNYWTATVHDSEPATQIVETGEIATVEVKPNNETVASNDPLEEVWEKSTHLNYLGYEVRRSCYRTCHMRSATCSDCQEAGKRLQCV